MFFFFLLRFHKSNINAGFSLLRLAEVVHLVYGAPLLALVSLGAPVAQWVKRWPTDLADRVRSSLEVKSSQP